MSAAGLILLLAVGGGSGAGVAQVKSAYTPYSGTDASEPDLVTYLFFGMDGFQKILTHLQCKIKGFLRCERVDMNFHVIKTEEFISIEGMKFRKSEAREEADQHAGMYSFMADETGGLAVFMIGKNDKNMTQVKTI